MNTATATESVAANVRAEMGRKRVSILALAGQVGINRQTLSRRLSGEVAFTVGELVAVSNALEVDFSALISPHTAA